MGLKKGIDGGWLGGWKDRESGEQGKARHKPGDAQWFQEISEYQAQVKVLSV